MPASALLLHIPPCSQLAAPLAPAHCSLGPCSLGPCSLIPRPLLPWPLLAGTGPAPGHNCESAHRADGHHCGGPGDGAYPAGSGLQAHVWAHGCMFLGSRRGGDFYLHACARARNCLCLECRCNC